MDPPYSPEKIVLSTFQHPDHPTGHNRFCQIFRDHWFRWCDFRMENEVPVDQRANVTNIVQRMMLCRDPEGGYARYICPGCGFACTVLQAQVSIGFLSPAKPAFALPAAKSKSITGSTI
jgi:hypothetical protein